MAKYSGTSGHDRFWLSMSNLAGSTVSGGAGTDTLAISNGGAYTFSKSSYASLSSIERLDFSAHLTGTLSVLLDSTMMTQSGAGTLTIVSGQMGIDNLRAGSSVGGQVFVGGTGHVWLDGSLNNIVRVANGATTAVHGRGGSDTLYASATGSVLDGGAGNDTMYAGSGADTFVYASGYKRDTIGSFDVTTDKIDVGGAGLTYTSEVLARVSDGASGAVFALGNGDTLTLTGVSADALTAANFVGVQAGAPTYTIGTDVTATQLQALLDGAGDGATFILSDGVHIFDRALTIRHDNVTVRGASESGTVVRFAFAAGTETDGLTVRGGSDVLIGAATTSIAAGQTSLTLATTAGLRVGDTLYVSQANDTAYMAANGWNNVSEADYATRPFREAHVEIASIDGNTVHLRTGVPMAMDAGAATVYRTALVRGVTLADFTIDSGLGAANANDFVNVFAAYQGLAALRLADTYGAMLSGISILNPHSLGLDIEGGLGLTADGITVRGAWNKGSGGNGYGIQLGEMSWATLRNLDITDTRHAFLFSGWDTETNNTIHIANTNRDINFHGGPETGNVITVDRGALSYNPAQNTGIDRGYWALVGDNVTTHANVDPYAANAVTFRTAYGFDAADLIYAATSGGMLSGRGGHDVLIGAGGTDVLAGGTGRDTMTGGTGDDVFVFGAAQSHDVVTDFADGDRLVFTGLGAPQDFGDIAVTQATAGVLITYAGGSILLQNMSIDRMTAQHFEFDAANTWAYVL